ncbi:MAG: hypothetical protein WAM62_16950 [Pseudolabrys sp.]
MPSVAQGIKWGLPMRRFKPALLACGIAVGFAAIASAQDLSAPPPLDINFKPQDLSLDPPNLNFNPQDLAYSKKPKTTPVFIQGPPPAAMDWTGVFVGGYFGGGYQAGNTTQNFNPIGANAVGMVDPSALPGGGLGSPASAPGTQALSSTTYNAGNAYARTLLGLPSGSYSPVSYPGSPTTLSGDFLKRLLGLGGVELGFNKQFGSVILGVAGDFSFPGAASSSGTGSWNSAGSYAGSGTTYAYCGGGGCAGLVDGTLNQQVNGVSQAYGTTSANLTWLGTARGTIGFAGDRMMVYGTGGFAFGRINMSSSANWSDSNLYTCAETGTFAGTCAGLPQGNTTTVASWAGSQTGMKYGYAAGGGFGYAVTDHLIAKTEVLYYDLGSSTLTVNGTGTRTVGGGSINIPAPNTSAAVAVSSYTVTKQFNGVVAKLGLAYKF